MLCSGAGGMSSRELQGGKVSPRRWLGRGSHVGFCNLPHPSQQSCPSPEPHLEQAQHGHSGLGGTEGTSTVQVH